MIKTTETISEEALPRIFVQIASYRDPECQWTVKDLFDKADHPERITVGICWQFIKGEDEAYFVEPYPFPQQVRVHEVDSRESKGACWARSLTQQLWRGEEFTFQIDSHMRFEEGWDTSLLAMYEQCGGGKTILTCYPPNYTPPDIRERRWVNSLNAHKFNEHGVLILYGALAYPVSEPLPAAPMPGAFISGNTLFGPSSMITDVPYDPYIFFLGEEITLAVRLWTHGYNIYHPNQLLTYHYWERSGSPTHFVDHHWVERDLRSLARVKHLLGTEHCDDVETLRDLDKYGLGTVRTLAEYEAYSGIDFVNKTKYEGFRF